ncbi:hypothetical protein [Nitrosomonas sp. Is37]|nr:hypothetical protein [Nitrosomonas sp. Is37]MDV6344161.1 hypothetical protein [Nitrosomonas sp. Is37]SDY71708.1 hypothetical protein SAMN05421755_10428 [Nitrosomonas sp. Nm33]
MSKLGIFTELLAGMSMNVIEAAEVKRSNEIPRSLTVAVSAKQVR